MEDKQKKCLKNISDLLAKNKVTDAFTILDNNLSNLSISTDLTRFFVTTSSQFYRVDEEFRLGTISWEQYNISNSQVIVKALDLAKEVCSYLHDPQKRLLENIPSVGIINSRSKIQEKFEELAKELALALS